MHKPSSSERGDCVRRGRRTLVLPLTSLAGAIALVALAPSQERVLLADSNGTAQHDQDMDGLPDAQENVLGTNPHASDSDNDGFSDLEELARQSDPSDGLSLPTDTPVNVGLAARTDSGVLTIITAVYMRHTETSGFNVSIGVMANGTLAELPSSVYLANAMTAVFPAAEPGDVIGILQTPYPEVVAHDLESISFWSVVTPGGEDEPTAADAIDLVSNPDGPALLSIETVGLQGKASAYVPIFPGAPSASWSPGQLCEQSSQPMGNIGPIVEHRIEDASCEEADGYCSPTCTTLAGSTFQTVDPLALLGG